VIVSHVQVVALVTKERIHRVYVVDPSSGQYKGVISLVDVLGLFATYL
jgi:Mg/Co/Ni transporter MgtE